MFATFVIRRCSKVKENYTNVLSECYNLHIQIENKLERNDLEKVENYIRNYPPVFTAAGFFQLSKEIFSSFFSATVTYLILLIQFNTVEV